MRRSITGIFHHTSSHDGEPPNSRGLDSCDHFISGLHRKDTLPLKKRSTCAIHVVATRWNLKKRSFVPTDVVWRGSHAGGQQSICFTHIHFCWLRACLLVVPSFGILGAQSEFLRGLPGLVFGNHLYRCFWGLVTLGLDLTFCKRLHRMWTCMQIRDYGSVGSRVS